LSEKKEKKPGVKQSVSTISWKRDKTQIHEVKLAAEKKNKKKKSK